VSLRPPVRVPAPPGHLLHEVDALTVGNITKYRTRCVVPGCTVRSGWRARIGDALAELHDHEDTDAWPRTA
jgi:hypothetical protein